jgi:hypothetical protein
MLTLRNQAGQELTWTFSPRSAAANACLAALDPQGTREQVSIEELLGKFVRVQTQGGVYNAQHPRPWWLTILGEGEVNAVRGLKDLSQPQPTSMPGMPAPQAAPVQQTPPPPVQQQQQQQQPAPQIQAAQQRAAEALGFQQNAPANTAQMNPNAFNGDPTGGVYDYDLPF